MRIQKYKQFRENLSINPSDNPANKIAKEDVNKTEDNLKEYKNKQAQLTSLYTQMDPKTGEPLHKDDEIAKELEKLENPYLRSLTQILSMERRILILTKKSNNDKLAIEDLRQQLENAMDTEKSAIQERQNKAKESLDKTNVELVKLEADVQKSRKDFDKKMADELTNLKKSINKLN